MSYKVAAYLRLSKNEFDIGKESNIEIVEKGVSLTVKENTLT